MLLKILRAKIHNGTITESQIDYVGSITIDRDLMDAAGILPGECVLVADLTNGARHETYVMEGKRGSRTIGINGAAARLVNVADRVIIMAFAYVSPEEAKQLKPSIILLDEKNNIVRRLSKPALEE